MNYESMSDFEINKAAFLLAAKLGLLYFEDVMQNKNPDSDAVMYGDGANWYAWNGCNSPSDAWPIIIENNIGVYAKSDSDYEIGMCNFTGCWCANGINSVDGEFGMTVDAFEFVDENPLRAAMIVFLMMNESE